VASLTEVFLRSQVEQIQRSIETPGMLLAIQPHVLNNVRQQLDLSSFVEKQQLPFGVVLLEYSPKGKDAPAKDADVPSQP